MSKLGKKSILLPKESSVKVEGALLYQVPKVLKKFYLMTKYFLLKLNDKK